MDLISFATSSYPAHPTRAPRGGCDNARDAQARHDDKALVTGPDHGAKVDGLFGLFARPC